MGRTALTVVAAKSFGATGQRAGTAVRAKPEVNVKNSLSFCLDHLGGVLDHALEEFRVPYGFATSCFAVVTVHQNKFNVGGIAQCCSP